MRIKWNIAPHDPLDISIWSQKVWEVAVSEFVVRLESFALKHDRLGFDIDIPTEKIARWNAYVEIEPRFVFWPVADKGGAYAWKTSVAIPETFAGEEEYFS